MSNSQKQNCLLVYLVGLHNKLADGNAPLTEPLRPSMDEISEAGQRCEFSGLVDFNSFIDALEQRGLVDVYSQTYVPAIVITFKGHEYAAQLKVSQGAP